VDFSSCQAGALQRPFLAAIAQLGFAAFPRAICAAKDSAAARFHTVSDDLAATMLALRSEHLNRTFKTIEHVSLAPSSDLEGFVVVVTAQFAFRHRYDFAVEASNARVFLPMETV
jgi:hypothetical protein